MREELITTMQEQLSCYKELLLTARKKKDILVAGKVHELEKLMQIEEELLLQVGYLERRRLDIAVELGLNEPLIVYDNKQLMAEAEGQERLELLQQEQELGEVCSELQQVNNLNQQLIQQSLEVLDYSLGLIPAEYNQINFDRKV